MDSSTPTTESPRAYGSRFSFDHISITSSETNKLFDTDLDTDSFIYKPSFASSETSVASYKTERTINSRKSRYNALPRHKYAGIEDLRSPRGPVSLDVNGASILETESTMEALQPDPPLVLDPQSLDDEYTSFFETESTTEALQPDPPLVLDPESLDDDYTSFFETESTMEALQPDPRLSVVSEPTVDDIIRFHILSIGRSSLINRVFGINAAEYKPGEAGIQQELVSPENQFFVLHDSKGFEPGDLSNLEIVREFVQQRSRDDLPLSERIHGLWLCTMTPTAAGRVFETGDEKLLQFAHENQVPIVIVFTQYARLVRTKEAELRQKYPGMKQTALRDRSVEEARMAFEYCLKLLKRSMERLQIPMPRYAAASVRPGHLEDVSDLVQVTRDTVKEGVERDAWLLWTKAQRNGLPFKVDACVTKFISYYRQALLGTMPGSRQLLLRDLLGKAHEGIISCWGLKGEVLNCPEFQQLMLSLVQDVVTESTAAIFPPDVSTILQFVTLATAASAPIFPPVAILGTTYVFVRWLSMAVLENVPSVQRFLIAYTVDLIGILRELFDHTLRAGSPTPTWTELQEAIVAYELSSSHQRIRHGIFSKIPLSGPTLTIDDISRTIRELLQDSPKQS